MRITFLIYYLYNIRTWSRMDVRVDINLATVAESCAVVGSVSVPSPPFESHWKRLQNETRGADLCSRAPVRVCWFTTDEMSCPVAIAVVRRSRPSERARRMCASGTVATRCSHTAFHHRRPSNAAAGGINSRTWRGGNGDGVGGGDGGEDGGKRWRRQYFSLLFPRHRATTPPSDSSAGREVSRGRWGGHTLRTHATLVLTHSVTTTIPTVSTPLHYGRRHHYRVSILRCRHSAWMKILWLYARTFRQRRGPSLPLFIINFSNVQRGGRDFVGWYFANGIPAGYCCKLRPLLHYIYTSRRVLCTARVYKTQYQLNTYIYLYIKVYTYYTECAILFHFIIL